MPLRFVNTRCLFFVQSSISGRVGGFCDSATVTKAAVNTGCGYVFQRGIPFLSALGRSGIAGSHGCLRFDFLRILHTIFHRTVSQLLRPRVPDVLTLPQRLHLRSGLITGCEGPRRSDGLNSSSASVSDAQTKPGKLQPRGPARAHQSAEVQPDRSAWHPGNRVAHGGAGGVSWSANEPQGPAGAGVAVVSPESGRQRGAASVPAQGAHDHFEDSLAVS